MQVRNISNYSLGVTNNYNNRSAKAAPNFTARNIPTPGVFEYKADSPFKNLLFKISAKIVAKMNKPLQKEPEMPKEVLKITPEAQKLYDKVQKKCDGSMTFTQEKSPILKKMADYYRQEEILSARNAKKS